MDPHPSCTQISSVYQKEMNLRRNFSRVRRRITPCRRFHFHRKEYFSMRTASSRQRLVSWDDCKGSADKTKNVDDKTKNVADKTKNVDLFYDVPPMCTLLSDQDDSSQDSIHRRNHKRYHIEHPNTFKGRISFYEVCDDIQLNIASFLDISDGSVLMQIDKRRYEIIKGAIFLWGKWCIQRWPHLPDNVKFVDISSSSGIPNYPRLLNIASEMTPPTSVDKSSLEYRGVSLFRSIASDSTNVIQYLKIVGTGDRCVRANRPLIRPVDQEKKPNLFKIFGRNDYALPKPFISPFMEADKVILTPRLVSYFEVSILQNELEVSGHQHSVPPSQNISDCIAIGLSSRGFRWHARMPGWDANSYGYHGDDGGIFHASGDMLKRFGPSYGKGDTIGCGVDYACAGIFFTINGKFLGYGWKNQEHLAGKDFYPTIGIDSKAPVDCNFGEKKFQFDLCTFIQKQNELLGVIKML